MKREDYTEMMDALRDLNNGLRALLCLNWTTYPWAKKFYYQISNSYEDLRIRVQTEELFERKQQMDRHEKEEQDDHQ